MRKFAVPMSAGAARNYLKVVLEPLRTVFPSFALYERAITLQERWRFSFHDLLIIGSAIETECSVLYSEDLHDRQKMESLSGSIR